MHYLQKAILDKLRFKSRLNYTALMPEGIESSHFRYHLKQLMGDHLVQKDAEGMYTLTDAGQREVDYLSEHHTTLVRTPKVITYTLLTHQDQLLLYQKPKEPYRGRWGLIGGKLHFGEDSCAAAQREVFEKTGLSVEQPYLCGVADIIITKNGEPLSHAIAYVHRQNLPELPQPLPESLAAIDRSKLSSLDLIPDVAPLVELVDSSTQAFVRQLHCQL